MPRWLALAVQCPSCARRPAMRATVAIAEALRMVDPDEVIASYECQRCRTRYVITAAAYQRAA